MADTLLNIPGLTPSHGPELGDTIFETPGELGVVDEENLLSGLFGGRSRNTVNSATASGSADMNSLFGSTAGKAVMGGVAAFLAKELLDKRG